MAENTRNPCHIKKVNPPDTKTGIFEESFVNTHQNALKITAPVRPWCGSRFWYCRSTKVNWDLRPPHTHISNRNFDYWRDIKSILRIRVLARLTWYVRKTWDDYNVTYISSKRADCAETCEILRISKFCLFLISLRRYVRFGIEVAYQNSRHVYWWNYRQCCWFLYVEHATLVRHVPPIPSPRKVMPTETCFVDVGRIVRICAQIFHKSRTTPAWQLDHINPAYSLKRHIMKIMMMIKIKLKLIIIIIVTIIRTIKWWHYHIIINIIDAMDRISRPTRHVLL